MSLLLILVVGWVLLNGLVVGAFVLRDSRRTRRALAGPEAQGRSAAGFHLPRRHAAT